MNKNGLFNVLTTISDRKKRLTAGSAPAFGAVIENAQDYYRPVKTPTGGGEDSIFGKPE
jgi:hypothetical protein